MVMCMHACMCVSCVVCGRKRVVYVYVCVQVCVHVCVIRYTCLCMCM